MGFGMKRVDEIADLVFAGLAALAFLAGVVVVLAGLWSNWPLFQAVVTGLANIGLFYLLVLVSIPFALLLGLVIYGVYLGIAKVAGR